MALPSPWSILLLCFSLLPFFAAAQTPLPIDTAVSFTIPTVFGEERASLTVAPSTAYYISFDVQSGTSFFVTSGPFPVYTFHVNTVKQISASLSRTFFFATSKCETSGQMPIVFSCQSASCQFSVTVQTTPIAPSSLPATMTNSDEFDTTTRVIPFTATSADPIVVDFQGNQPLTIGGVLFSDCTRSCGEPDVTPALITQAGTQTTYGQLVLPNPVIGTEYTFVHFGSSIFSVNITQTAYRCNSSCIGTGVCVQGGCACDLSWNPTSCSVPGLGLVSTQNPGYSGSASQPVFVARIDNSTNLLYNVAITMTGGSGYIVNMGKDCAGENANCYATTVGRSASTTVSLCPQDPGYFAFYLASSSGSFTYTVSLSTSDNSRPILRFNEILPNAAGLKYFSFTASAYIGNPTLTLISPAVSDKSIGIAPGCNYDITQATTFDVTNTVAQLRLNPLNLGEYFVVYANAFEDFELILGEAGNCSALANCNGNGACLPNNTCTCYAGYSASNCSVISARPVQFVSDGNVVEFNCSGTQTYAVTTGTNQLVSLARINGSNIYVNARLRGFPNGATQPVELSSGHNVYYSPLASSVDITYFAVSCENPGDKVFFRTALVTATVTPGTDLPIPYPAGGSVELVLDLGSDCNTRDYSLRVTTLSPAANLVVRSALFEREGTQVTSGFSFHAQKTNCRLLYISVSDSAYDSVNNYASAFFTVSLTNGGCNCNGNGACTGSSCSCQPSFSGSSCQTVANCQAAGTLSFCHHLSNQSLSLLQEDQTCSPDIDYYDQVFLPQLFNASALNFSDDTFLCRDAFQRFLCDTYLRPCTSTILQVPCNPYVSNFFSFCPVSNTIMASVPTSSAGIAPLAFLTSSASSATTQTLVSPSISCRSPFSPAISPSRPPSVAPSFSPTIPPPTSAPTSPASGSILLRMTATISVTGDGTKFQILAFIGGLNDGLFLHDVSFNVVIVNATLFTIEVSGTIVLPPGTSDATVQQYSTARLPTQIFTVITGPYFTSIMNGYPFRVTSATSELISSPTSAPTSTPSPTNSAAQTFTPLALIIFFLSLLYL